jgi:cytochrome o ubiquinol oxidase subunit IV
MSADGHAVEVHTLPAHGEAGHGTLGGYLTGFILSVILTAIPFWLVMDHVISNSLITSALVLGLGAIQIIVHMVFFLHMNTRSEGGWSLLALMFTMVLLGITLAGSIWVLYHMNTNMMPMTEHDMRNMP